MEKDILYKEYIIEGNSLDILSKKYHIGKLKLKKILIDFGIDIRKKGGVKVIKDNKITDWKIEKYKTIEGYHYIATDKNTGFTTNDYLNKAGVLTNYIHKTYNIDIPTLYDRRKYYMETGDYWWERWFDIKKIKNNETKKCKYCNWETVDISNKSGAYEQHLLKVHNITKENYLKDFPEEKEYFITKNPSKNRQIDDNKDNYVVCAICGKKLARIDNHHLKKHNITKLEYIQKYGNNDLISKQLKELCVSQSLIMNLSLENKENKYTSQPEKVIKEYIENLGIKCNKNRSILNGKELDIFIEDKCIAIEFNGLQWHTERFGKKHKNYHLDKLTECNSKGIKLIQIFEDEWVYKREIVLSKIKHILGYDSTIGKIYGRKCNIREINKEEAELFLENNHIQGFAKSTVYLGCFYCGKLVGVMSFLREKDNKWNLTRFATDINYICCGVGGKLFNWFIKEFSVKEIKTFADRRWTVDKDSNLYTKLGFKLDKILSPNYTYYNNKIERYKRIHKFNLRKKNLIKLGNFSNNINLTESEMSEMLGFDRIYDCGLLRYVWKNKK
jgi:hypothetical protein